MYSRGVGGVRGGPSPAWWDPSPGPKWERFSQNGPLSAKCATFLLKVTNSGVFPSFAVFGVPDGRLVSVLRVRARFASRIRSG